MLVAVLLLGLNEIYQDKGKPVKDPIASATPEKLSHSLNDSRAEYRMMAAEELVRRHHPSAGDLLLPLLQDPDGNVRGRAAVLLGQLRDIRAVDRIVLLLDNPNYGTQLDAVRSLGLIGDGRAVAPLLSLLYRPNFAGVAAEALAKIGDQRAVGPLIGFLEKAKKENKFSRARRCGVSLILTGCIPGCDGLSCSQSLSGARFFPSL